MLKTEKLNGDPGRIRTGGLLLSRGRLSYRSGFLQSLPWGLWLLLGMVWGGATPGSAQERSLPENVSPQARELVDQVIEKLGGEKFRQIESISARGRFFTVGSGGTAGVMPFESQELVSAKRRFSYGKKKPIILVNDGDKGWRLDRLGRTRQTPEQIWTWRLRARYNLYGLLLRVTEEPDILMVEGGTDLADNVVVRVVEIVDVQQVKIKLLVDKTRYLPVRIQYRAQNPKTNRWEEYGLTYGNYQKVQGVLTPKQEGRWLNGRRRAEVFFHEIYYNLPLSSDLFVPTR